MGQLHCKLIATVTVRTEIKSNTVSAQSLILRLIKIQYTSVLTRELLVMHELTMIVLVCDCVQRMHE